MPEFEIIIVIGTLLIIAVICGLTIRNWGK